MPGNIEKCVCVCVCQRKFACLTGALEKLVLRPTHLKKVCVCVIVGVFLSVSVAFWPQEYRRPDIAAMAHARKHRLEEAKRRHAEKQEELDRRILQLDFERGKFEIEKADWATRYYNAGYEDGMEAQRKQWAWGMSPPDVPLDTPARASIQV